LIVAIRWDCDHIEHQVYDVCHRCSTPLGPGGYRRLLRLGGLGHNRQALDAGVVARVVGDERDVVFEGGRGDPGVGYSYWASLATRSVGSFGPPEAHGAVEGKDDKVAQMLLHPGAACLPPVTFERPPVQLGDRHEGDYQELTGQVGTVSLGARIAFEEIGHNVGVHDYCGGRCRGHL
jgi:hypothetical protein